MFVHFDRVAVAKPGVVARSGVAAKPGAVAPRRGQADLVAGLAVLVIFFGVLIVSVVGVDVLGNRPVFFLFGEVTPAVGFAVLGIGVGLLASTARPGRAPDPSARVALGGAATAD